MPATKFFSAEDVRRLPDDGKRYETIHGELLVTPAPAGMHQVIVTRLTDLISPRLRAEGVEQVLTSPADVSWGFDTLVQPDVFVADIEEFKRTGRWSDVRTVFLAIEIISVSSTKTDRGIKRRLYQEMRIPEYWVVDFEQQRVERWTPEALVPAIERGHFTWQHPVLDFQLGVDVPSLLSP